ncbi:hypothetical protein L873DRAFT_1822886, partial [Choiromyces venosus 120613-1]
PPYEWSHTLASPQTYAIYVTPTYHIGLGRSHTASSDLRLVPRFIAVWCGASWFMI